MKMLNIKELAYNSMKFEKLRRRDFLAMEFPKVRKIDKLSYILKTSTSVPSHQTLIPKSECQEIIQTLKKNEKKFNIANIDGNLYKIEDVYACLKIHEAIEIKNDVVKEIDWFKACTILNIPPHCKEVPNNVMENFKNLLHEGKMNFCVTRKTPSLLTADIADLVGQKWINLQMIETFVDLANNLNSDTIYFSLPSLRCQSEKSEFKNQIRDWKTNGVNAFAIVINVGKYKNGKTYPVWRGGGGCHWSMLGLDIANEEWFYSDTLAWKIPETMFSPLLPFIRIVREVYGVELDLKNIKMAHQHDVNEICNVDCVQNYPFQGENQNICGVASIVSMLLFGQSTLRAALLNKSLPDRFDWMHTISEANNFLRCTLIKWYISGEIDLESIGIEKEIDNQTKIKTENEDVNVKIDLADPDQIRKLLNSQKVERNDCNEQDKVQESPIKSNDKCKENIPAKDDSQNEIDTVKLNGWQLLMHEKMNTDPSISFGDVSKEMRKTWMEMDSTEREEYNTKAKAGIITCSSCGICGANFKHLKRKHEHEKSCGKEFPCADCEKSFKSKKALLGHSTAKHGRQFECQTCKKCFESNSKLERHKLSHGTQKHVTCDICGKGFGRKDNMLQHKKKKH